MIRFSHRPMSAAVVFLVCLTALTGCIGTSTGPGPSSQSWPASQSGRPAFYYFGSGA